MSRAYLTALDSAIDQLSTVSGFQATAVRQLGRAEGKVMSPVQRPGKEILKAAKKQITSIRSVLDNVEEIIDSAIELDPENAKIEIAVDNPPRAAADASSDEPNSPRAA